MYVDELFARLAESGVSVMLKADHERMRDGGRPWTLVIFGPALGEAEYVRAEERTYNACLRRGLERLVECGEAWNWVRDYLELLD